MLNLSGNKIADGAFLKELKGLSLLNLSGNKIADGAFLKELKGLSTLDLSENKIADYSFLKELKGLVTLHLSRNKTLSLSVVTEVPNLITLRLNETTVSDLPENYTDTFYSDIEGIRSYYRQKLKKTDTLHEAKVLFVGEPEAGKTSLMKRLSKPGYKIDPAIKEHSTLGITIHWDWSFDFPNPQNRKFKAHLWDFGGQQIQYYIHQFFLTEDALYILVLDDRKEAPNIDYWFRIIHLLGRGSPVLVVRNRKNIDAATGFDWNKYQNRYKNDIKTLVYEDIDLVNEDNRFPYIENQIKELLLQLGHVGKELPASWMSIREEMINIKGRNHITVTDFQLICRRYDLTEEVDQLAICNYLNTLGILLHFRNDASLAGTIFVNPQWISGAVYMILSDRDIEATHGRFEKTQLYNKWSTAYSYEEKNMLLTLMQKAEFDLIYKVDNSESDATFIAPILLSDVAPAAANSWQRKGTLCFRYRYKFMPMGIITRIIVRLNDLIVDCAGEDQVWKSGVILEKDGCTALVKTDISHEGLNIIDISIQGDRLSAKDFLAHIRGTIDAVHKQSFKDMDVELLVPCNCEVCQEADEPYLFEFSRLKEHINENVFEIRCEKKGSFKFVSIERLLGGIVVRHQYDREIRRDYENHLAAPSRGEDILAQYLNEVSRASARQNAPSPPPVDKGWKNRLTIISVIVGILIGLAGLYKFFIEDILKQPKPITKIQLVPPPVEQNTTKPTEASDTAAEATAVEPEPDSSTEKSVEPLSR